MAAIYYKSSNGKFIEIPFNSHEILNGSVTKEKLSSDLQKLFESEDITVGHNGYYIQDINTKEKWVTLSEESVKPECPTIGTNVFDLKDISYHNAPYTGVYRVKANKDVIITNETGHTISLTTGDIGYFYLINGDNNLVISDKTAIISFEALDNNGLGYSSNVTPGIAPLTLSSTTVDINYYALPAGGKFTFHLNISEEGLYYIAIQMNDANTNLMYVETDTGFCGNIQQYQWGWNFLEQGAGTTDLLMVYLRKGRNNITIENRGSTYSSVGQFSVKKTAELNDSEKFPQYVEQLDIESCAVVPKPFKSLDITSSNQEYKTGFSVGDIFSMVNGAHYDFCGTITDIRGNKIFYEKDLPFNVLDRSTNNLDDHIFFVPSKPEIGVIEIVTIAFATGINTKAVGKGSFCCGKEGVAGGDYSVIGGRRNFASYCSVAFGLDCLSYGRYAFSAGCICKAFGEYSAAINMGCIAYDIATFAHGEGTIAGSEAMEAGGKYNSTLYDKIIVYGNGKNVNQRSDAYWLDWDGNGWYSGVVNSRFVKQDILDIDISSIFNIDSSILNNIISPGIYNYMTQGNNDNISKSVPLTVYVSSETDLIRNINTITQKIYMGLSEVTYLYRDGQHIQGGEVSWGEWSSV